MNPEQIKNFERSMDYCHMLITRLERSQETIRHCFEGEPQIKYLHATERVIDVIQYLRVYLDYIQHMQQ